MEDEIPRRPFDHQVEPFFAGLGIEQRPASRPARRGARAASVLLLTLLAASVLAWWLT